MNMLKFLKFLEKCEYYHPSSFWLCTISVYLCFPTLFHHLPSFSTNAYQAQVIAKKVRLGGQQEGPPKIQAPKPKRPPSTTAPKPKNSEGSAERIKRLRFRQPSGNPSGNGNFNDDIGTKEWDKWVCPNPEENISYPGVWSDLADDPDVCTDDDFCEDEDQEIEEETQIEKFPRRRLLAVPGPTPTGKLDSENIEKFDFTQRKLKPMKFPSREGIQLSMDQRSLRKIVYSHPNELGLSDLDNRIPCPLQVDPNKFQRQDCWAITDTNIREAVIKVFEHTTFTNPRIVTLERFRSNCSTQRAIYFVDIVTGNAIYFRVGGKQDGKLWSVDNFKPEEIINMMKDPNVKKITGISDYNFNKDNQFYEYF